jgi:hypothetical protein
LVPRLVNKERICGFLGEISAATYDKWQARGYVPGPMPGTNRYDVKAHDKAIDACSGLVAARRRSPLEEWEAANEDQT